MPSYLLTDDINDSIFCYVGKTEKPLGARQYEHWLNYRANPFKNNWVKWLKIKKGNLVIKELGNFDEYAYINAYNLNPSFICLNSEQDKEKASKYNNFAIHESKNPHLTREIFENNYYQKKNKINFKSYFSQNKLENPDDIISHKSFINHFLYPYSEDERTHEIIENREIQYDYFLDIKIRDIFLFFSASQNSFYYDLLTKSFHDYKPQSEYDIEQFNENLEVFGHYGWKFNPYDFYRYLYKTKNLAQKYEKILIKIEEISKR